MVWRRSQGVITVLELDGQIFCEAALYLRMMIVTDTGSVHLQSV